MRFFFPTSGYYSKIQVQVFPKEEPLSHRSNLYISNVVFFFLMYCRYTMWRYLFLIATLHCMVHYMVHIMSSNQKWECKKWNFHCSDNGASTKLPQWLPINKRPVVLQGLLSACHAISGVVGISADHES